jgi:hypothetical protein
MHTLGSKRLVGELLSRGTPEKGHWPGNYRIMSAIDKFYIKKVVARLTAPKTITAKVHVSRKDRRHSKEA